MSWLLLLIAAPGLVAEFRFSGDFRNAPLAAHIGTSGAMTVTLAGVPLTRGESLVLGDPDWRPLYSSGRVQPTMEVTQNGDATVHRMTYADPPVNTTKTVREDPTGVAIRYDIRVAPDPQVQHVELTWGIPPEVLEGGKLVESGAEGRSLDFGGSKHSAAQLPPAVVFHTFLADLRVSFEGSTGSWWLDDLRDVDWARCYRLRFAPAYDPATGYEGVASLRFAARPPSASPFTPLDLGKAANRSLRDERAEDGAGGWTDQGDNDLRALMPGAYSSRGVPWQVSGSERAAIILRGRERPAFPDETPPIAIRGRVERLYFVQATAWQAEWREEVAAAEFAYADGRTLSVPIRHGVETADWWGARPPLQAAPAWTGENAQATVGLYLWRWDNPRPDVALASVVLRSTGSGACPILVAATALRPGLTAAQTALLDDAFSRSTQPEVSTEGWLPIAIPWRDGPEAGSALDVSFLLDPPAGKHGFLKVEGGHFVFEKTGQSARFWGTNAALRGPFPEKSLAPQIAEAWAQQGVNMARMHLYAIYDETLLSPDGGLNPEMLDRLEYLIAQLAERGIYTYMDLNDGMIWQRLTEETLPDTGGANLKRASIFDRTLIDCQKRLAAEFFTHTNPYRGLRMCDDPAVALYEITNENSLLSHWSDTKSAIPEPYYSELEARWNAWLRERYGSREELAKAWETEDGFQLPTGQDPVAGTVELPKSLANAPMTDGRRFALELQTAYLGEMYQHLRSIGVKAPIAGNNLTFSMADLEAARDMDFTAEGNYWDHPNVRARPITYNNQPALRGKPWEARMVPELGRTKLAGKPFVAREWNFCFPNDYRCEGLLYTAAYASFQDWDGLLFYCATGSFDGGSWGRFADNPAVLIHSQQTDPATWGLSPLAALLYLRGAVRPDPQCVTYALTEEDTLGNRGLWSRCRFAPLIARTETLLTGPQLGELPPQTVAWHDASTVLSVDDAAEPEDRYREFCRWLGIPESHTLRSRTGALEWAGQPGVLTIRTPSVQAACGAVAQAERIDLGALSITAMTRYCTIAAASLTEEALTESSRILLCAVGGARNTDQQVENGRLLEFGKAPVLFEPVSATLMLQHEGASGLQVRSLDPATGAVISEVPVNADDGRIVFQIGPQYRSIYYEIARGS